VNVVTDERSRRNKQRKRRERKRDKTLKIDIIQYEEIKVKRKGNKRHLEER
jgi:7,8-dihydro-6-hydroxymethylpterin-pyrophosphokinase